jgi:predicted DNA binding CopG/RHH family protein
MSRKALKSIPAFDTAEEFDEWFDTADLSEYDFVTGFRPFHEVFRFKDARVNMRMPASLLQRLKAVAAEEGMPYQRLMREFLERGLVERARRIAAAEKKKAS